LAEEEEEWSGSADDEWEEIGSGVGRRKRRAREKDRNGGRKRRGEFKAVLVAPGKVEDKERSKNGEREGLAKGKEVKR
jgi:hypothetical protein